MLEGKEQKLRGHITISRTSGGNVESQEKPVCIEIADRASGLLVAEVRLDLASYAEVLTGRSRVECDLSYWRSENIGKQRTGKTVKIPLPEGGIPFEAEKRQACIEELLSPYEVDGWRGRRDDVTNFHKRHKDGTASVHFFRYEEIDG